MHGDNKVCISSPHSSVPSLHITEVVVSVHCVVRFVYTSASVFASCLRLHQFFFALFVSTYAFFCMCLRPCPCLYRAFVRMSAFVSALVSCVRECVILWGVACLCLDMWLCLYRVFVCVIACECMCVCTFQECIFPFLSSSKLSRSLCRG